eukprot:scaffold63629_cov63-Phaeocystis_antarctica.AAC.2
MRRLPACWVVGTVGSTQSWWGGKARMIVSTLMIRDATLLIAATRLFLSYRRDETRVETHE